ncbi:MAG: 1-deoxy-D-xylulose-5-phosphate reductoisomerase [Bacteroidales bacterium]|nr:1-deoxy-D-xylulose-5-phosphate reductoisomerase [Bacteroidales bacterium]
MKKRLAILGSTGSIGTQTLDIVRAFPEQFAVEVLTAQNNAGLLVEQAMAFQPNAVVIGNKELYPKVNEALAPHNIKVFAGSESIEQIVGMKSIDLVVVALVGYAGLRPTYQALQQGKPVALANKETLVVAGGTITQLAAEKGVPIFPVDSEHSAIFQCLQGEYHNNIDKIILTASGGPFFGRTAAELEKIRPEEALQHPKWKMGAKVTIDSATLMNKGLEMMEACWLFQVKPEQIEIVVHPQSIIHSMVQFADHSVKAQLGVPDMRLPIAYALSYPQRLPLELSELSFRQLQACTFFAPDRETFRCLPIAYHAMDKGGSCPCSMNAANEIAVAAFLQGRIRFPDIPYIIEETLARSRFLPQPQMDDYIQLNEEARTTATEIVNDITRKI